MRAFLEHGLHQTAEGTGVLIFASLLEREAVVLGDHGIHARVGDAEWQATVAALVAGMKRGRAGRRLRGGHRPLRGAAGRALPARWRARWPTSSPTPSRSIAAETGGAGGQGSRRSRPPSSRPRRAQSPASSSSWWLTSTSVVPRRCSDASVRGQRPPRLR